MIVTGILRKPNSGHTPCIFDTGEAWLLLAPHGAWNVGPIHHSQHRDNTSISPLRSLWLEGAQATGRETRIFCELSALNYQLIF